MARDAAPVGARSRSAAEVLDSDARFFATFAVGRLGALFVAFFRAGFFVAWDFVRFFAIGVS